jgi:hypothetical protein
MTRRRWIYFGDEAVEVSDDYIPEPRQHDGLLWNDRLYQDDGDPRYNSRAEHREYMRRNDLSMVGDYTETWKKAAKARAEFYQGKDSSRKEDVASALQKVRAGYRPKIQPQED